VAVGSGVGSATGGSVTAGAVVEDGVGVGAGVDEAVGVGVGLGAGVAEGRGAGVARGLGVGDGTVGTTTGGVACVGVGVGLGRTNGVGVGVGVGDGVVWRRSNRSGMTVGGWVMFCAAAGVADTRAIRGRQTGFTRARLAPTGAPVDDFTSCRSHRLPGRSHQRPRANRAA
jgi:hypothetical protein